MKAEQETDYSKQTLQGAIGLNAWEEWLNNPDYNYPVTRKVSLPSLRDVAEGARQILGRIPARRKEI